MTTTATLTTAIDLRALPDSHTPTHRFDQWQADGAAKDISVTYTLTGCGDMRVAAVEVGYTRVSNLKKWLKRGIRRYRIRAKWAPAQMQPGGGDVCKVACANDLHKDGQRMDEGGYAGVNFHQYSVSTASLSHARRRKSGKVGSALKVHREATNGL